MASLDEVRANHPVQDEATYQEAYAEADLAGRIAAMAYGMRTAAGISQTELARRMGTSQPAIARLENAGSVPSIAFLARLAAATGVELSLTASGVAAIALPQGDPPVRKVAAKPPAQRKRAARKRSSVA